MSSNNSSASNNNNSSASNNNSSACNNNNSSASSNNNSSVSSNNNSSASSNNNSASSNNSSASSNNSSASSDNSSASSNNSSASSDNSSTSSNNTPLHYPAIDRSVLAVFLNFLNRNLQFITLVPPDSVFSGTGQGPDSLVRGPFNKKFIHRKFINNQFHQLMHLSESVQFERF
ncbi:hypothetical protein FHG87_022939 [Trinorchestia longiramus]|nr:hypothetical protein FHG87_022939 [Trinorchestia longiramus]